MNSCKNCAGAVYDPDWGEVICGVYNHRIRNVDKYLDCQSHKPKDDNSKEENKHEST
jgi:hypothetical protein